MSKASDMTVCWIDNGLFVDFSSFISDQFKKTYYWTPWVSAFPTSNNLAVGEGLAGIERIKFWEDVLDEVDLFIFPDVYFGPMQKMLEKMGKKVWGSRGGEFLELARWRTHQFLKSINLPVAHAEQVQGTKDLRLYLQSHPDVWIKISGTRGDMETWHSETYQLSETRLDALDVTLGALKNDVCFIVEDDIPDAVESGFDGWCVDGEFTKTGMAGFEIKDAGYIIAVRDYASLPAPIRDVNSALSPVLKKERYRGFFSTEIRIDAKHDAYLIDPCCRCGSPPNEVYQNLFSNWGSILAGGADGVIVEPEPVFKFGVEALMHSGFADSHWQSVFFPEEIRPYVKLRNHCIIDGRDYIVPQVAKLPEIGAVIGLGKTLEEAIDHLQENAAQVKGYYVEIKMDSIPRALEEMKRGEEMGISLIDKKDIPNSVHIESIDSE